MKLVVAILVMSLVACAANVGTGAGVSVPKDSAATCGGYCHDIGLELSSVVIMASNVGCVCSPAEAAPTPGTPAAAPISDGSTAAGAGMAAMVLLEQSQQQQQQAAQQAQ